MFGIRGFKAGRELEDVFEDTIAKLSRPPNHQSKDGGKAQAEQAKAQQQMTNRASEATTEPARDDK